MEWSRTWNISSFLSWVRMCTVCPQKCFTTPSRIVWSTSVGVSWWILRPAACGKSADQENRESWILADPSFMSSNGLIIAPFSLSFRYSASKSSCISGIDVWLIEPFSWSLYPNCVKWAMRGWETWSFIPDDRMSCSTAVHALGIATCSYCFNISSWVASGITHHNGKHSTFQRAHNLLP